MKTMSRIMDELKRVLKKTGSCWINLGDTYSNTGTETQRNTHPKGCNCNTCISSKTFSFKNKLIKIQTKSRYGIPERFYINCIDSGWIARNHIPWYKSNSMPSSAKDRFTNKWESIFFFVKEQKYYFNLDAVREKTITESKPFNVRVRESKKGLTQQKLTGGCSEDEDQNYNAKGEYLNNESSKYNINEQSNSQRLGKFRNKGRWKNAQKKESLGDKWRDSNIAALWKVDKEKTTHESGKNPGDVFFINPRPFAEAHFATFPVDLPLKILKCACPPNGIVLDPFFGAGTTAVAAEQLGLQWIGIELSKDYIKIAEKRLEPFTNEKLEVFT